MHWLTQALLIDPVKFASRAFSPPRNGLLNLPGVSQTVELLTDDAGRPHIFAGNLKDLYLAQGFVHGKDRLFQLELNRRTGQGRLSELFGEGALPADRFLRRIGLHRLAKVHYQYLSQQVDPNSPAMGPHGWQGQLTVGQVLSALGAYAQGINLAAARYTPLEFKLLGLKFEPFTVTDCLLWTKLMAFEMASNWEGELARANLITALGPQKAHSLYHSILPKDSCVVPQDLAVGGQQPILDLLEAYQQAAPWLGFALGQFPGSNCWAVRGCKSVTGKPLLASDPHLALRLPSIWYPIKLSCPLDDGTMMNVQGASMPGVPGVMIGRTGKAAWGFTNSFVDTQDLFIHNSRTLQGNSVVPERILIKGGAQELLEVELTAQGPLMGPRRPNPNQSGEEFGLSLHWCGFDYKHDATVAALLQLNRADTLEKVQEAAQGWTAPCMNLVAADCEGEQGNIGYWVIGTIPRRRKGIGLTPVPAEDPDFGWDGYLEFAQKPQCINPEQGFVATANDAPVGADFPHHLSLDFMGGFRGQRIRQLLASKQLWSAEDFRVMQSDVTSLAAQRFVRAVESIVPAASLGALEQQMLQLLSTWDGEMSATSAAASCYQVVMLSICRIGLLPQMGEAAYRVWMGAPTSPLAILGQFGGRYTGPIVQALENQEPWLLPDGVSDYPTLLGRAFEAAAQELQQLLGPDPQVWTWGKLHTIQLAHPLGVVPALGPWLNGPTLPFEGDTDTICQSVVVPHDPYKTKCWAPSFRMVAEVGGSSRSVLPGGVSGLPNDRHYLSQFSAWHKGQLLDDYFDRAQLERLKPDRLYLNPL